MGTKIDLIQLIREIRHLERHQKLYRVLRDELKAIGLWRVQPRGNPSKGFMIMKERQNAKRDSSE